MISGMMKINKIIRIYLCLAGILFSILFTNIAAAENKGLEAVLNKLSTIKKSIATFKEIKTYNFLNEDIKLTGQLEFIAPDTLIKKTIKPEPEYFKVTGNNLFIKKEDGKEHDLLLTDYPLVEIFVAAYRGILSGNLTKLQQYYDIKYTETSRNKSHKKKSSWMITLIPLDEDAQNYIELIKINGTDAAINKITTIESGGDKSVMFIKAINN